MSGWLASRRIQLVGSVRYLRSLVFIKYGHFLIDLVARVTGRCKVSKNSLFQFDLQVMRQICMKHAQFASSFELPYEGYIKGMIMQKNYPMVLKFKCQRK